MVRLEIPQKLKVSWLKFAHRWLSKKKNARSYEIIKIQLSALMPPSNPEVVYSALPL